MTNGARYLGTLSVGAAVSAITYATLAGPAFAASAANPLSGFTAGQIAAKAVSDLKTATSVHVSGKVADSGMNIKFSISMTQHGCTGTLNVSKYGNLALVGSGNAMWFQPSDQFWKAAGVPGSELPALSGK